MPVSLASSNLNRKSPCFKLVLRCKNLGLANHALNLLVAISVAVPVRGFQIGRSVQAIIL